MYSEASSPTGLLCPLEQPRRGATPGGGSARPQEGSSLGLALSPFPRLSAARFTLQRHRLLSPVSGHGPREAAGPRRHTPSCSRRSSPVKRGSGCVLPAAGGVTRPSHLLRLHPGTLPGRAKELCQPEFPCLPSLPRALSLRVAHLLPWPLLDPRLGQYHSAHGP